MYTCEDLISIISLFNPLLVFNKVVVFICVRILFFLRLLLKPILFFLLGIIVMFYPLLLLLLLTFILLTFILLTFILLIFILLILLIIIIIIIIIIISITIVNITNIIIAATCIITRMKTFKTGGLSFCLCTNSIRDTKHGHLLNGVCIVIRHLLWI